MTSKQEKKPRQKREKLLSRIFFKVVDKVSDIGVASMAAHPVTIALGVMVGSVIGMSIISMSTPDNRKSSLNRQHSPYWHLYNLSAAAQGLAVAAAVAPVIPASLNLIGQAVAGMGSKAAPGA